MSDLDDLARVATRATPSSYVQREVSGQRRRRIILLVGGSAILLLAVVAASVLLPALGYAPLPGTGWTEPGFEVSRGIGEDGLFAWWTVTNAADTPLVVRSVYINGEFAAAIGEAPFGNYCQVTKDTLPAKLTIGESAVFVQRSHFDPERSYGKSAVYLDFATNRGTFRYRVGKGFR